MEGCTQRGAGGICVPFHRASRYSSLLQDWRHIKIPVEKKTGTVKDKDISIFRYVRADKKIEDLDLLSQRTGKELV